MLGLTTYQEALRAIGRLAGASTNFRLIERLDTRTVDVRIGGDDHILGAEDLELLIMASIARRGERRPAGPTADLLRAIGFALDELQARGICIALEPDQLTVQYSGPEGMSRDLSYGVQELEARREA